MSRKGKRSCNDFHESYYEHRCAIIDTMDVLKSDIRGSSYMVQLKRWWHGLFLLSCYDKRCKSFYTSSEAMKIKRLIHFRKYRGRIHPLSRFSSAWDFMMLVLFTTNFFIFNHSTSIMYNQVWYPFAFIGVLIDIIIIVDVVVNMLTGYIDYEYRKIILCTHDALLHYCSTKFFLHVASAIPLQCILLIRYGTNIDCTLCKANKFVVTLKILNIFELYRIFERSSIVTREWDNYKFTYIIRFFRISFLGFLVMMNLIDLSDVVILLTMINNGQIEDSAFVSLLISIRYASTNEVYEFYLTYYSRVLRSIYLFGFSTIRTSHHLDNLVSLLCFLVANMFAFWLLIELYAFLCQINFFEDRVFNFKNMIIGIANRQYLPDEETLKINKFCDFNYARLKPIEQGNHLFRAMPKVLKREIVMATNTHYIKNIPYFEDWPLHILDDIVLMLKEEIYLKNDIVAEPWVQSEGLIVVSVGELAVYEDSKEIGHLSNGDYFGELALVTDMEIRTSTVLTVTDSVVLIMDKFSFRTYMRGHPDLFHKLKQELLQKFSNNTR